MKTIQEFYNEVMADNELKTQFIEAAKENRQEEFLKEHDCEATTEEIRAFLEEKSNEDAPLSFDELENAAGGECQKLDTNDKDVLLSALSFAIGCIGKLIDSAANGKAAGDRSGEFLCNVDRYPK